MSNNFSKAHEAARVIGQYLNYQSNEEWYLQQVQPTAAAHAAHTATGTTLTISGTTAENFRNMLAGVIDGGTFFIEMLNADANVNDHAVNYNIFAGPSWNAFPAQIICNSTYPAGSGNGLRTKLNTFLGMPPSMAAVPAIKSPNRDTPAVPASGKSIGMIQIREERLNFAHRGNSLLDIFLNSIPPLEWSKAVPYLDIELMSPAPPVTQRGNIGYTISNLRFLNGISRVIADSPDGIIARAKSTNLITNSSTPTPSRRRGRPRPVQLKSSAGMEIFTTPQSMLPVWEKYSSADEVALSRSPSTSTPAQATPQTPFGRPAPIIDKMRPFMTLKKVKISMIPSGHGSSMRNRTTLSLTLHDRSRLGEISQLIKPSSIGNSKISMEWGWSHPEGQSEDNPFGKFINAMRQKQIMRVLQSNYSFTDDGQCNIELTLYSVASRAASTANVALTSDVTAAFTALNQSIRSIRNFLAENVSQSYMTSIISMSGYEVIQNLSPTDHSFLFNADPRNKLQEFLASVTAQAGTTPDLAQLQRLISALMRQAVRLGGTAILPRRRGAPAGTPGSIATAIQAKMDKINADIALDSNAVGHLPSADPTELNVSLRYYMLSDDERIVINSNQDKINLSLNPAANKRFATFGQLALQFIAQPIQEGLSGNTSEVQLIFSNLNDSCSYMKNFNIGAFPIELTGDNGFEKLFEKERNANPNITPAKFFAFIREKFISNQASQAYGFSVPSGPRGANRYASIIRNSDTGVAERTATRDADRRRRRPARTAQNIQDKINSVLHDAYGSDSNLIFRQPNIKMYIETVPAKDASAYSGSIVRIHIYDETATAYKGQRDSMRAASTDSVIDLGRAIRTIRRDSATDLPAAPAALPRRTTRRRRTQHRTQLEARTAWLTSVASSIQNFDRQLAAAQSQGIFEPTASGGIRIAGGPQALISLIKKSMPSITLGQPNSTFSDMQIQSNGNSASVTTAIQRSGATANSNSIPGEIFTGLPLTMMPMKASGKLMGCPLLSNMTSIFIDCGTGTSVDNVYRIKTIEHTIEPGVFMTNIQFQQLQSYGIYQTPLSQLRDIAAQVEGLRTTIDASAEAATAEAAAAEHAHSDAVYDTV